MVETAELTIADLQVFEKKALDEFVAKLEREFPCQVEQIRLFGSKARGDSEPDSDIDVLIIVRDEDWQLRNAISTVAARVSLKFNVVIGTIVIGVERWRQMGEERFTLYRNIEREGVVLHDRG